LDTPEEYWGQIEKAIGSVPVRLIAMRGRFDSDSLRMDIDHDYWDDQPDWVATTRLDADDFVSDQFIEWVHAQMATTLAKRAGKRFAIEFRNGVLYSDRLEQARCGDSSRDFCTVVEPYRPGQIETCYGEVPRCQAIQTRAMWGKVIHATNCLHPARISGRAASVGMDVLRDRFASAIDGGSGGEIDRNAKR